MQIQEKELQKIREEAQKKGFELSDEEFENIVQLAKRKVEISKKGECYLLLLLPDAIKEYYFRACITGISILTMEGANI